MKIVAVAIGLMRIPALVLAVSSAKPLRSALLSAGQTGRVKPLD